MKYQITSEEEYKAAVEIFKRYLALDEEKKCFVGIDDNARICRRDSMLLGLSDPEALFDNCFFPLSNSEDINITDVINKNMNLLVESDDLLEIYQAVRLIFTQNNYMKMYEELPFVVDVKNYIDILRRKVAENKAAMETYNIGEFAKFRKNMYEQAMNMLNKCEVK